MARVEIPAPADLLIDAAGNVLSGRAVTVKLAGTATVATHWSALVGGTSTTGGLVTHTDGTVVNGSGARRYVDSAQALDITIGGLTRQVEPLSAAATSDRSVGSTVTSNYTVVALDYLIKADATSAAFALTLPSAVGLTGREFALRATHNTGSVVQVLTAAGQVVEDFNLTAPVQASLSQSTVGALTAATYYYKVTALSANGETLASNEQSIVVSAGAIAVPVQSAGSTSTTGGALATAKTYIYTITALNANGETTASNEVTLVTGAGSTNSNTVNWAAVSGATSYKVYRRTTDGLTQQMFAPGNVITYVDTGSGATSAPPPGVNTTGSKVTVSWAAVTGATSYRVYRGTSAAGENVYYPVIGATSYVDSGLIALYGSVPASNGTILTLGLPTSGAPYREITVVSDGANWRII